MRMTVKTFWCRASTLLPLSDVVVRLRHTLATVGFAFRYTNLPDMSSSSNFSSSSSSSTVFLLLLLLLLLLLQVADSWDSVAWPSKIWGFDVQGELMCPESCYMKYIDNQRGKPRKTSITLPLNWNNPSPHSRFGT